MKITIDETPEEHVLTDREGVELKSGEPFLFRCCDCSLVHRVVIVSQDGKPVGFAVQREPEITEERRQGQPEPDDWKFKLFQKLRPFYRIDTHLAKRMGLAPYPRWSPRADKPWRELTYEEFLHRLAQGLLSPGGRTDSQGHPRPDDAGLPGRPGIWREDASGQWTSCGARRA